MVIAGIIIFFGAEFFVSLFTDNQEAVESGAPLSTASWLSVNRETKNSAPKNIIIPAITMNEEPNNKALV